MRQYFAQGWVTGSGPLTDDLQTHIWCGTGDISGDTYKLRDDNVEYTNFPTGGSQGPAPTDLPIDAKSKRVKFFLLSMLCLSKSGK